MNPIFSLSYPEYAVALELSKHFKKNRFSIYIPLSRQEKGVDLILASRQHDNKTRCVTIQVKSSRGYTPGEKKYEKYNRAIWFKRFRAPRQADFIVLFSLYEKQAGLKGSLPKKWKSLIMVFRNREMVDLMKQKKENGRLDSHFAFVFDISPKNVPEKIRLTRPKEDKRDYNKYLLDNRLGLMVKDLMK